MEINSKVKAREDYKIVIARNWTKRSTGFFYNTLTNKYAGTLEGVDADKQGYRVLMLSTKPYSFIDIAYDEENKMLVFILLKVDTKQIIKDGNTKEGIVEVDRIYVDKDKDIYYKPKKDVFDASIRKWKTEQDTEFRYTHGYYAGTDMSIFISRFEVITRDVYEEVTKLFPRFVTLTGNNLIELNNLSNIWKFIKYKEPVKKYTKKQEEVDKFTKIELPEVTSGSSKRFCVISRVPNMEYCVLRTFISSNAGFIYEGGRIYIGKNDVISCKKDNSGTYIPTTLLNKPEHWNFVVEDFDSDITKGTKLEYFGNILNEIKVDSRSVAIWSFIKWDITERLFKSEFKPVMKHIIENNKGLNPMEYLTSCLGYIPNDTNIYKALGINRTQATKVIEDLILNFEDSVHIYSSCSPILLTKIILNGINFRYRVYFERENRNNPLSVSNFDDNTFNKVYDEIKKIISEIRYPEVIFTCLSYISRLYGPKALVYMIDPVVKLAKIDAILTNGRTYRGYSHLSLRYIDVYRDYLEIVSRLDDTRNFKPHFKDKEDITRMHDAAMEIYNITASEYSKKLFENHIKRWKKWEYTDGTYSIIAPKEPAEMAYEGITLHHCVKSYIDRVANGITNIMFLRKNEAIDEPFFTIEITNPNEVQQIHGFGNRNIDTEPDIIPFVNAWIKDKKLKKTNINKVR